MEHRGQISVPIVSPLTPLPIWVFWMVVGKVILIDLPCQRERIQPGIPSMTADENHFWDRG
ncbi:uncharacterized protein BDW47DRAFT_102990 [Aspergillus candidus]|uniref:Uncharacterized protein n=1 Tax=Aspergillus candidus TaxID=41067 RepID=A0A2I2FGH8_ASPCN|nr:hypothetical protein BDW47DRAFT_102990 [Aspergillus candidus]PLB39731.1 hypothetical protein BDW47DRAFT_102990 [Aspergillus candidus]